MKRLAVFVVAIAAVLGVRPQAVAAQDVRHERVSFKAGASSATVRDSIRGEETIDYLLGARAGQTMSVTLKTDNGANSFNVLPPASSAGSPTESLAAIGRGELSDNAWTGTLPVDGDYMVRVYLMRSAARRNETAHYTLNVGITSAPARAAATSTAAAGDAKVPGTPYHATGKVPCSVGPDPKGSAQCSFGVIRGAPGNAEVRLAAAGYDVALHPDEVQTVFIFKGDTVTSRDSSKTVTAEKNGATWSIGVDDFYFYTIPEAVISGG